MTDTLLSLSQDLRQVVRSISRQPAFASVVIVVLALGVGATTTIFSVVDQTILRPPPFLFGERLVDVLDIRRGGGGGGSSHPPEKIVGWQQQPTVFERLEAYAPQTMDLTDVAEPERILALTVSVGLFDMLGVQPVIGRGFFVEDGSVGADRVVILSQRLAERRWSNSAEAVGTIVRLSGVPYTVIGVMPADFRLLRAEQAWLPIDLNSGIRDSTPSGFFALGRLPLGYSVTAAQKRADEVADYLQKVSPLRRSWDIRIDEKRIASVSAATRTGLFALLGAVAFLLLLTIFNVAQLLLTRADEQRIEVSIRAALGATRARIVRLLVFECLVFASAGAIVGTILTWWGLRGIVALAPADLVTRATAPIVLDGRIVLTAFGLSLLAALFFGFVPTIQIVRQKLGDLGKGPGPIRSAVSFESLSLILVAVELSFSLMLVVGATLMLRTVANLDAISPGFDPNGVVAMNVDLPSQRYPTDQTRQGFFETLRERLRGIQGVEGIAVAYGLTFGGFGNGVLASADGLMSDEPVLIATNMVSSQYFDTLRIPMIAGRTFDSSDDPQTSVIVNQSLATRLWPSGQALGRRFRLDRDDAGPWKVVVGVVGDLDVRLSSEQRLDLQVYEPWPIAGKALPTRSAYAQRLLIVRAQDPVGAIPQIRGAVWSLDRNLPIERIELAIDSIRDVFSRQRFVRELMTIFAFLGLLLTGAGVFSVLWHSVVRRSREIGIRMAVGASSADVTKLILYRVGTLLLVGVSIGALGASLLARSMEALLYGVPILDGPSFGTAVATIVVTALSASWIPARRAARTDPAATIRHVA
jgi:putative ABC transport system permease protein